MLSPYLEINIGCRKKGAQGTGWVSLAIPDRECLAHPDDEHAPVRGIAHYVIESGLGGQYPYGLAKAGEVHPPHGRGIQVHASDEASPIPPIGDRRVHGRAAKAELAGRFEEDRSTGHRAKVDFSVSTYPFHNVFATVVESEPRTILRGVPLRLVGERGAQGLEIAFVLWGDILVVEINIGCSTRNRMGRVTS